MGEGLEIWRGGVEQWECDAMGHLNVGFYLSRSMQGLVNLAAEMGMPRAFAPDAQATLQVREQHVRFVKEARPGAPLIMTGGILEMNETEARLLMVLRHASGELSACFQTVVAHVTARDARPFAWPRRVLERAEGLGVEVPEGGAPRGIDMGPVASQASLERARTLGLTPIAMGAILPADCDVFGRMRSERLMAAISEGAIHIFSKIRPPTTPDGARIGGAALEYRVIHLAWPRAGDRFEFRSGFAGGDARIRRPIHWMLDPETGRAWGVAEAVVASFDLDRRKVVTLEGADLAAAEQAVIPGLTL